MSAFSSFFEFFEPFITVGVIAQSIYVTFITVYRLVMSSHEHTHFTYANNYLLALSRKSSSAAVGCKSSKLAAEYWMIFKECFKCRIMMNISVIKYHSRTVVPVSLKSVHAFMESNILLMTILYL